MKDYRQRIELLYEMGDKCVDAEKKITFFRKFLSSFNVNEVRFMFNLGTSKFVNSDFSMPFFQIRNCFQNGCKFQS